MTSYATRYFFQKLCFTCSCVALFRIHTYELGSRGWQFGMVCCGTMKRPYLKSFLIYHLPTRCHRKPSEEFELTANSLEAHMKVTGSSSSMGHSKLILRTLSYLTVNSQEDSHCELSVSWQLTV